MSENPGEPVRDAGGVIHVPGYNKYMEITATINGIKTVTVFSGKV